MISKKLNTSFSAHLHLYPQKAALGPKISKRKTLASDKMKIIKPKYKEEKIDTSHYGKIKSYSSTNNKVKLEIMFVIYMTVTIPTKNS